MLDCPSPSQLAKTVWERDGKALASTARFERLEDGLLIFNATKSDAGRYRCLSVEKSRAGQFTATVAEYQVDLSGSDGGILPHAHSHSPSVAGLRALIVILVVCLLGLLTWNCYKGHIPRPWNYCRTKEPREERGGPNAPVAVNLSPAENKVLVSGRNNGTDLSKAPRGEATNDLQREKCPSLQFIDDESEI